MISTLTSKGQLTIPINIRKHLQLKTGDKIQFVINAEGKVEIDLIKTSLSDLKGCLPKPRKKMTLED